MCTETILQYTCGCCEVEEINFCELLLQPRKGHYANGAKKRHEVVTVDAGGECEECAEKREEEEIRKAMEESLKEKGGKEKEDKKMSISEGGRDDGREEGGAGVAVGADGADGADARGGYGHGGGMDEERW
ncbi:hypothetical protein IFR04_007706 [Cadophora malorum]|uniref:Uncharacterized protein n=1 Tax=Cadophora malorum TaxID=108018 RepID=A0A8H7W6N7_9HELO|nr:hypothetical protein IFR04_007706 [Cadophora malorum]